MNSVFSTYKVLMLSLASIVLSIPVTFITVNIYWDMSSSLNIMLLLTVLLDFISTLRSPTPPIDLSTLWELFAHSKYSGLIFQFIGIPLLLSFTLSVLFIVLCLKSRVSSKQLAHVSGPKFYLGNKAIKHAQSKHKHDLGSSRMTTCGVNIHPKIKITQAREQNNFLILGTTGAGKSTVFKPLVKQAIERGDNAVIYDEKAEYTENFYHKETSILIAPWDKEVRNGTFLKISKASKMQNYSHNA